MVYILTSEGEPLMPTKRHSPKSESRCSPLLTMEMILVVEINNFTH